MIVTAHQDELAAWLHKRIQLVQSPGMVCVGRLNAAGELMAVVGFDNYNGASAMVHCAGEGNWISRSFLWAVFNYAFQVMQCSVIFGMLPYANARALRLSHHLGFQLVGVIDDACLDGGLAFVTLRPSECRYLPNMAHVNMPTQTNTLRQ